MGLKEGFESRVSRVIDLVTEEPGKYDLKDLTYKLTRKKGSTDEIASEEWTQFDVWSAVYFAISRGRIEARDDGRVKRNYYPACNGCPKYG